MYAAIFALFLGTLSIGTTEFVIAGILPAVAADLDVTIPQAGLLVTSYAIGVALGGPAMALALARIPRKTAAVVLMSLFFVGHIIVALAADYSWAMVGRIVCSIGHGGYFGVAVVLASQIAPKDRVGTALSFIFAGVTIANIVGVPVGAAIGAALGWRAPIWMVAAMAGVGLVAVMLFVPVTELANSKRASLRAQFGALLRQDVLASFGLIFLMMVAIWGLNTFIAPYLTDVVGMPSLWIPAVLLLGGAFSTLGIFLGGRLADVVPSRTMRISYPLMAALYLALFLLSSGNVWLGALLATIIYLPITAVWTTVSNRALAGAKDAPDLVSTLLSSASNVGAASGSWLAASALTAGYSYRELPLLSLVAVGIATCVAFGTLALDRKSSPERPGESA